MSELKRPPTQNDVARLAGVSRGTVSLVLNARTDGNVPISDSTRDKVLAAARELGYAPNPVAQMLAQGINRIIGIFSYEPVFPYNRNDFFFPYLTGIQQEARKEDFNLLLFTRNYNEKNLRVYHNGMNTLRLADGSILLGANPHRDELSKLVDEGYPFVYIGRRSVPNDGLSWVGHDYVDGGAQVVRHLLGLGHERLAFVGPGRFSEPQDDKITGCQRALADAGHGELIILPPGICEQPEAFFTALKADRITALICDSQASFLGSLRILYERGLSVPEDCSVVSMTTEEHSHPYQLQPTFVQINQHELGIAATQMLTRHIAGDYSSPRQALVPSELVIGGTSAPPHHKS